MSKEALTEVVAEATITKAVRTGIEAEVAATTWTTEAAEVDPVGMISGEGIVREGAVAGEGSRRSLSNGASISRDSLRKAMRALRAMDSKS